MAYTDIEKKREASRRGAVLYRQRHPERFKIAKKKAHIKMTYGLTVEQYQDMFLRQQGLCGICRAEFTEENNMHIDHNHQTGQVRGLLCRDCNFGIGFLRDDPKRLMDAIFYLSDWAVKENEI
jgi:5-methylcytosine-specific restriction endonuclease McrA